MRSHSPVSVTPFGGAYAFGLNPGMDCNRSYAKHLSSFPGFGAHAPSAKLRGSQVGRIDRFASPADALRRHTIDDPIAAKAQGQAWRENRAEWKSCLRLWDEARWGGGLMGERRRPSDRAWGDDLSPGTVRRYGGRWGAPHHLLGDSASSCVPPRPPRRMMSAPAARWTSFDGRRRGTQALRPGPSIATARTSSVRRRLAVAAGEYGWSRGGSKRGRGIGVKSLVMLRK